MSASTVSGGLCRDCLCDLSGMDVQERCPSCGSPRLVQHDELAGLSIAHIDCDAFFAAVEKRDNPALAERPVIIGGGRRGVVSTACYVARIKGVRSAMPMFKALALCPEAVVIRPDIEKYSTVGREIRSMMMDLTPLVEPLSIDEAFLDLGGTERLHGSYPALTLIRFADRIRREIGITVSVGLSYCKFLAKIASDLDKPRGFSVIGRHEARDFLARQPVTLIWGVGKSFAATLQRDGITTIGQLQNMAEADLIRRYGVMGQRLSRLSLGQDARKVHTRREAKSISAETTFNQDLSRRGDIVPVLRALSEKVARRLKRGGLAGYTITLKLKGSDFRLLTRNRHLDDPTRLADRIFHAGLALLDKELNGASYRLIGIGVSHLCDIALADPPDLIDRKAAQRAAAELAMDAIRERFGGESVMTGYTFAPGEKKMRSE